MIKLNDAKRIIAAGETKAAEIGQPMNIAVVDAGGNLVAHVRMDGAWIGSIDISIEKAFTLGHLTSRRRILRSMRNREASSSGFMPRTMAEL